MAFDYQGDAAESYAAKALLVQGWTWLNQRINSWIRDPRLFGMPI
jgi:hypothetical protein